MKKPVRLLLSIFCLGVLLIAAFILAVNLYVQSAGMQTRIRQALSDAVGLPASLFRTTFSPWGGFRLDQIKVASLQESQPLDFLQAERLEVRCEWIALLRGEIVLKRIALDSPVFVFRQNSTPSTPPAAPPPKIIAPPATPAAPAAPAVMDGTPAPAPASPPRVVAKTPARSQAMDIRKMLLRDGVFKFLAKDGSEIFRLEGVRCSLNASGKPGEFTGNLEVGKAVVFQTLEIGHLESPVALVGRKLTVQKVEGTLASGHLEGFVEGDFSRGNLPYTMRLKLAKARLAELFPRDSDWAERLSGVVNGRLDLAGSRGKNTGRGELKISQARASHLPWLQTIGQLSHGGDWENLNIGKAEMKFEIADSAVQIAPSSLVGDHLELALAGSVNKKQKLDLAARLLVDDDLFKKLPTEARDNFVANPGARKYALDFHVDGTLSAPRSNFMDRFIGDRLKKRVQQFLHSFIQSDPDDPTPEPTPTPTDEASPLPTIPPTTP